MHNDRYDLAIRAVLCGTSLGRPVTRATVERIIGDSDLTGFFAYMESSSLARHFRMLNDGRYIIMGVASKELPAKETPISNSALTVFLFILKWNQDNSMPVPKAAVTEQFVSSERSAARVVDRAISELKGMFWIDERQSYAVSSGLPVRAGQISLGTRPGRTYTYVPTSLGIQSLGPKFLQNVVTASQGREFEPSEVSAFFQTAREAPYRQTPALPTLFDSLDPDPRLERAICKVLSGTAAGKPPTMQSLQRSLGKNALSLLESYCLNQGLDRFFTLKLSGGRVVALVDASGVYQAGSGPVTDTAVALAVYIWYLEETSGTVTRADLLPLMVERSKDPGKFLSRTLTLLEKKGWIIRRSGLRRNRIRMTPAGKMCIALALNLEPGPGIESLLKEFVQENYSEALPQMADSEEAWDAKDGDST